jgi:putative heme iron utilization protein
MDEEPLHPGTGPADEGIDAAIAEPLCALLRGTRLASLGTLRAGAPLVSMVAFLPEPDFSAFWMHISRLAWHTQDLQRDARASLAILQADDGRADPQTLARVSLRGECLAIPNAGAPFERLRTAWLARFPESAITFELADFAFWRFTPADARFVAGLGRTHNLSAARLRAASALVPSEVPPEVPPTSQAPHAR